MVSPFLCVGCGGVGSCFLSFFLGFILSAKKIGRLGTRNSLVHIPQTSAVGWWCLCEIPGAAWRVLCPTKTKTRKVHRPFCGEGFTYVGPALNGLSSSSDGRRCSSQPHTRTERRYTQTGWPAAGETHRSWPSIVVDFQSCVL